MYLEAINFKRTKESSYEQGFYIGRYECDDLEHSIFLDKNYQELPRDGQGYQVYNFKKDYEKDIRINIRIENE